MGELRGVGLSVLLLLGGLLAVRGVAGESAPRRAAEAKAAADDDDASAAPAPAGACSAGQQLIDEYRALYGGERSTFRHLIVLIPDPVALRGRESFDSVFEGVEEAFAQSIDGARYVRDRHWFPLTDAPAAAACWEQEPGFVIYRPVAGTGAPPILALFVGETPTWGLRVAAMRRALVLAAAPAPPSRQTPFRYHILGPSFSGTAASLAAVLESVPGSAAIVSGTATNDGAIAMLSAAATARGSYFASVAPSDVELLRALGEFLRTRGGDCRRDGNMVLFTESGTTYGQAKDKIGKERGDGEIGIVYWNQ